MPNSRSQKQRIRKRMVRTGETYTQAMTSMRREREERLTARPVLLANGHLPGCARLGCVATRCADARATARRDLDERAGVNPPPWLGLAINGLPPANE